MTPKKHSPWVDKLEKEGLLEEAPVWRVGDPSTEPSITIQEEKELTSQDPTRPVEVRAQNESTLEPDRITQEVSLQESPTTHDSPSQVLRETMTAPGESNLPQVKKDASQADVAQTSLESDWFALSRTKPTGTYSHTDPKHGIRVHGQSISVEPLASSNPPAASGAIFDLPPPRSAPPPFRSSGAAAQCVPSEDFLFGGDGSADDTTMKNRRDAMRECHDLGDYSGALIHAEVVLSKEPQDREALAIGRDCRSTLERMYETQLGNLEATAQRDVKVDELIWRKLDPTTTFVLSLVDGVLTLENIIDICGLPRFDALRLLVRLKEEGIIR
jgi:hypothetical protein